MTLVLRYLREVFGRDIARLIFSHYIDLMRPIWYRRFKKRLRETLDELLGSVNQIRANLDYYTFDQHWGLDSSDADVHRWCDSWVLSYPYRICNSYGRGKWEIVGADCLVEDLEYLTHFMEDKTGCINRGKVYPWLPLIPGVAIYYIGKDHYDFATMEVIMEGRRIKIKVYGLDSRRNKGLINRQK